MQSPSHERCGIRASVLLKYYQHAVTQVFDGCQVSAVVAHVHGQLPGSHEQVEDLRVTESEREKQMRESVVGENKRTGSVVASCPCYAG